MQRILLIDNYDSFTYNLVQILSESGLCSFEVVYHDAIAVEDCASYDKILISPGPGLPHEAGLSCEVIRRWGAEKSILGVCLGHQAIGLVYGARLRKLPFPKHGSAEQTIISSRTAKLFRGLPQKFTTGHYHSWVIDPENLPACLRTTATDADGNIMAIEHTSYKLCGVQFHPESIMTDTGRQMMGNWLALKL
jgi:anthranilate synthase component II